MAIYSQLYRLPIQESHHCCRDGWEIPQGYQGVCTTVYALALGGEAISGLWRPKMAIFKGPTYHHLRCGGLPGSLQLSCAPGGGGFCGFWIPKFRSPHSGGGSFILTLPSRLQGLCTNFPAWTHLQCPVYKCYSYIHRSGQGLLFIWPRRWVWLPVQYACHEKTSVFPGLQ